MKRVPLKTQHPHRSPDSTSSAIRPLDDRRLREVRGGDGGITAQDDWEARI